MAAAHVAAATVNDVADREIDRINHTGDPGRPLVTGEASERDLLVPHWLACAVTFAAAASLGAPAPTRLARDRTGLLARACRALLPDVACPGRPRSRPRARSVRARSRGARRRAQKRGRPARRCALPALPRPDRPEDFRDRRGDAAYGRPTLLLRFDKRTTCLVSAAALVGGNVLLLAYLRPSLVVFLVLEGFVAAIASRLRALY